MESKESFLHGGDKAPERIKERYLAPPKTNNRRLGSQEITHLYEIEYERTGDVVKMVPGSMKDLGPVNEEEKARIMAEEEEREKNRN
ncbi:MAG: hypothetical protein M1334_00275 [Patescibacteria group bacterium]|nr:hypothetical protein [Patescibacteria group bacterium]